LIGDGLRVDLAAICHPHTILNATRHDSNPLPAVLFSFYICVMPDSSPLPAPATISAAILSASAVTRLGLACPSEQARQRAADDMALEIVERLKAERDQLTFTL